MLIKLTIAAAMLAALTVPSSAMSEWYLVRTAHVSKDAPTACIVVDRSTLPGEQRIAGPFSSQSLGLSAIGKYPSCEGSKD
jgi:hypothetical protein